MSVSRVFKLVSDLVIKVPRATVKAKKLGPGDEIEFTLKIIRVKRRRPTLKELMKGITKEDRHAETAWGGPVGKEHW